jgi:hypothetical protein
MVRSAAACFAALLLAVACGSAGGRPAAHEQLPSPPPETATPAAAPAVAGQATPVANGQAAPAQAPAQPQPAAPSVGHYWACVPPQNTAPDGSWPQSSTMCARLFPNFEPRAGRAVQLAAFQISPTPAGDYWSCDPQSQTNQPVTDIFISELAMAQSGLTPGQISAIEADPVANAPTYVKRPWSDPTGAAGAGVPLAAHKCGGA